MRQGIGKLGLFVAVILAMSACGGNGGEQSAAPETEASTTEDAASPGAPPEKVYNTKVFEPAFSFTASFNAPEEADTDMSPEAAVDLSLEAADFLSMFFVTEEQRALGPNATDSGPRALTFSNVKEVFDPSRPAEKVAVPAPEDMIAWLREHPNLEAGEPVPVTVGGVSGTQLDVEVSSVLRDYPEGCPVPCVNAWPRSDERGEREFVFFLGDKGRHIVLNVEGETVIVSIEAPEEKFEEFLPEAQEVLDTVEWTAES